MMPRSTTDSAPSGQTPLRIVIATDKFKGTLTAEQATNAIARGCQAAAKQTLKRPIQLTSIPISSGGEGFAHAITARQRAWQVPINARSPTDEPITATITVLNAPPKLARKSQSNHPATVLANLISAPVAALLTLLLAYFAPLLTLYLAHQHKGASKRSIVIESADIIGLARVPPNQRDPEQLNTAALAAAILAALVQRPQQILIALGGSATVDAGIGLAHALGYRFLDLDNRPLPPTPDSLIRIQRILPPPRFSRNHRLVARLRQRLIIAACDVTNPLLGDQGAARTYAPQKGATNQAVERLEAGIANLKQRSLEANLLTPVAPHDHPGDGAAGGLAFALRAFFNARLVPGATMIADRNALDTAIANADLIITGEGAIDDQSFRGKVVQEVARRASAHAKPTLILAGTARPSTQHMQQRVHETIAPNATVATLTDLAPSNPPSDPLQNAEASLTRLTAEQLTTIPTHLNPNPNR